MPNTKSAERRVRSSQRKRVRNRAVKTGLKTVEKKFNSLVKESKTSEAAETLRAAISALDKAAKRGTIPKGTADRKKSRLTLRLNAKKAAPAPAAPAAPAAS